MTDIQGIVLYVNKVQNKYSLFVDLKEAHMLVNQIV